MKLNLKSDATTQERAEVQLWMEVYAATRGSLCRFAYDTELLNNKSERLADAAVEALRKRLQ